MGWGLEAAPPVRLLARPVSEQCTYEGVRSRVWKRALEEPANGISGPQVQDLGRLLCSTFASHGHSWHCHDVAPPLRPAQPRAHLRSFSVTLSSSS